MERKENWIHVNTHWTFTCNEWTLRLFTDNHGICVPCKNIHAEGLVLNVNGVLSINDLLVVPFYSKYRILWSRKTKLRQWLDLVNDVSVNIPAGWMVVGVGLGWDGHGVVVYMAMETESDICIYVYLKLHIYIYSSSQPMLGVCHRLLCCSRWYGIVL